MPVQSRMILTGIASSPNSVALSQKPASGGYQHLTLNGSAVVAGVAVFSTQIGVSITSTGNESTLYFKIEGTNQLGYLQTEQVLGPNVGTVHSNLFYTTVTSVIVSGNTAGNITVGNVGNASPWFPMNYNRYPVSSQICNISPGAVLNYTVQFTGDDLQWVDGKITRNASALAIPQDHTTLTNQTISNTGTLISGVCGLRIILNSWTSGSVTMNIIQSSATAS